MDKLSYDEDNDTLTIQIKNISRVVDRTATVIDVLDDDWLIVRRNSDGKIIKAKNRPFSQWDWIREM